MTQTEINTDLYAALTVQNMLLEQIAAAMFNAMPDHGAAFMAEFIDRLRYKLNMPAGVDATSGVEPQALQAAALQRAEALFRTVRSNLRSPT